MVIKTTKIIKNYLFSINTGALILFFCLQGIDLYKHIDVL